MQAGEASHSLVSSTIPENPETMELFPYRVMPVPPSSGKKLVDTTDEDCEAYLEMSGLAALIHVENKDRITVDPQNVIILEPAEIMSMGAVTAEIRMSEKLMVVLDIHASMCGRGRCHITIDNIDGIITVACDGDVIFVADLTAYADSVVRLVYDGESLKAFGSDGSLIKEFEI